MGFIILLANAFVYMQSSTHELNGTIYITPDLILSVHMDDIHAAGVTALAHFVIWHT